MVVKSLSYRKKCPMEDIPSTHNRMDLARGISSLRVVILILQSGNVIAKYKHGALF